MERNPWARLRKTERNRLILELYLRNPDMSMAEIGEMFRISRQRVAQIIKRDGKGPNEENR